MTENDERRARIDAIMVGIAETNRQLAAKGISVNDPDAGEAAEIFKRITEKAYLTGLGG